MAVSVTCPGCRTSYPVTEDLLGKTIRCKKCQETFTATAARTAAGRGATDERIQTRLANAKTVLAAPRDDGDDAWEADVPQAEVETDAPAAARNTNKAVVIIASIAGILLAVTCGVTIWAFNRGSDQTTQQESVAKIPPPPRRTSPRVAETTTAPADTSTAAPSNAVATATTPKTPETQTPASTAKAELTTTTPAGLLTAKSGPRPYDFRPAVVEKVKKGAVFIKVTSQQGLAYGSGWFAEKHGQESYIITNSHVVGMKEPANPAPERIEIILESGTPQERSFTATLLALDREEDLAVLRIKGPDLPDPLPIVPSYDLIEGQKLLILGFPKGGNLKDELRRGLGVEVTTSLKVRPSTVAGRMFNKDGSVKYVQVEGGADPGNSGGAVVDTNGNVVAVLVAGDPSTNMRFVIPSEYVIHLLHGRVLRLVPGQAVASGGGIKQPIITQIADPMKRIQKISAEVWAGTKPDPKKGEKPIRPASDKQPAPLPGDGPRATAALPYDANKAVALGESHTAAAELNLPPLKENEIYWFQPHYVAKDGKERWGEAVAVEMGRYPVQAKPATLALQLKPDRRPEDARRIDLDTRQSSGFHIEGLGGNSSDMSLKASLTERVRTVEPNGNAKVSLQYSDLHLTDSDQDAQLRQTLRGVIERIKDMETEVTVTRDGRYQSPKLIFSRIPEDARPPLRRFNEQVIQSLEAMALALPNRQMSPGETWMLDSFYTVRVGRMTDNALFRMTCRYVGTRIRHGREEAVIELTGRVVRGQDTRRNNQGDDAGSRGGAATGDDPRAPGNDPRSRPNGPGEDNRPRGMQGQASGAAIVDLATGYVVLARIESDMSAEMGVSIPTRPGRTEEIKVLAGLYMDIMLRRSLSKDAPKDEDTLALLPNQVKLYKPLVGVGSPAADVSASAPEPERPVTMPRDVFDKVAKASVLLSVKREDSTSEGSGWFAEPNIVVTNAHVVGMESKTARPPEKIEVIVDAGKDTERRLTGKLITVNPSDDLAAVRVEGDRLPEPIPVAPAASLYESQPLTVFGFPKGTGLVQEMEKGLGVRDLKTSLKARPTVVSGRVYNTDQSVKFIQYEGGGDHGSSGAAVVDERGFVRAVHVAGAGSSMRFGIPGEYAARLIQGYPLEVLTDHPYLDGSVAKQPIEIKFTDPVKRVRKVAIDVWVGDAGKPRQATDAEPKSAAGDGPRQSFELKYDADKQTAAGEFPLPPLSPGQVYWLQPRFTNGTGKEQWSRATTYAPDGPPVERRPVTLAFKYKPGSVRNVDLVSYSQFRYSRLGKEVEEGDPLKISLVERTQRAGSRGTAATMDIEYRDIELDFAKVLPQLKEIPEIQSELKKLLEPILGFIRGLVTRVTVSHDGKMKLVRVIDTSVPLPLRPLMGMFNAQVFTSLQALTFPLPNREVPYGFTWEHPTNLFLTTRSRSSEASLFKMSFKYVGVRERAGRQEALVEIRGSLAHDPDAKSIELKDLKTASDDDPAGGAVAPRRQPPKAEPKAAPPKGKKGLYGLARGYAVVDVAGGFVAEVKLFIDLDVELTAKDRETKTELPVRAGGTMELMLKRSDSAGK